MAYRSNAGTPRRSETVAVDSSAQTARLGIRQSLRLTDKGRHIIQLLQDRKAVPYQSTADNPHYGAYWDAYYSNQSTYRYQPGLEIICKRNCDET